jgi:hypothetical protein
MMILSGSVAGLAGLLGGPTPFIGKARSSMNPLQMSTFLVKGTDKTPAIGNVLDSGLVAILGKGFRFCL